MWRNGKTGGHGRRRIRVRRLRAVLLVISIVVGLGACTSITSSASTDFSTADLASYAWIDASANGEDGPTMAVRLAFEEALRLRGIERVQNDRASQFARASFRVETRVQNNDPYYALYVAEEFEQGSIFLEIIEPRSGEVLWSGECRHRLRYIARTIGSLSPTLTPTDEERNWRVKEMVAKIISRIPES